MMIRVGLHTIETEVTQAAAPVLLACLHPNAATPSQLEMLEDVSKAFGQKLKVCVLCEEMSACWGNLYGIEGTPTYLMISRNRVIDRILGQVDLTRLRGCIERAFAALPAREPMRLSPQ